MTFQPHDKLTKFCEARCPEKDRLFGMVSSHQPDDVSETMMETNVSTHLRCQQCEWNKRSQEDWPKWLQQMAKVEKGVATRVPKDVDEKDWDGRAVDLFSMS